MVVARFASRDVEGAAALLSPTGENALDRIVDDSSGRLAGAHREVHGDVKGLTLDELMDEALLVPAAEGVVHVYRFRDVEFRWEGTPRAGRRRCRAQRAGSCASRWSRRPGSDEERMAGRAHVIAVPGDVQPWPPMFEIAEATPPGSWTLVGGLMVHVHAIRARVEATRPTRDVDVLRNIETAAVSAVAGALRGLGFEALGPSCGNPVHRFTRGDDVVDVVVARNVRARTRWQLRPLLRSPGAAQALQRRDADTIAAGARSTSMCRTRSARRQRRMPSIRGTRNGTSRVSLS
ncbi:hypothetical protein N8K70_14670 [Microbacterium betulae]|uniref:Uncharacterized protein n=1 Tax=Microbacterium betulae TaxID=2981139 RepID=A0AA97I5B0_9MICO|nr:hypothetical protein [Microbacterium sp. AB]WOF22619.1 hypothetical protein N8K70_14670 [Microbacterium sp. AB]